MARLKALDFISTPGYGNAASHASSLSVANNLRQNRAGCHERKRNRRCCGRKSGYWSLCRAGKIGMHDRGVYAASKFALVGLSESLYRELAAHHVKLTTICPSWVNTAMATEAKTALLPEQMIQPADILHTIRYLLALSASVCVRELSMECGLNVF